MHTIMDVIAHIRLNIYQHLMTDSPAASPAALAELVEDVRDLGYGRIIVTLSEIEAPDMLC
jgi:hypothetical protein